MTKNKILLFLFLPLAAVATVTFLQLYIFSASDASPSDIVFQGKPDNQKSNPPPSKDSPSEAAGQILFSPLTQVAERVTKKPFGIFITPQTSPVSSEKFRGYHTGVDFEIFPEELNIEVPVKTVCDGTLRLKEYATGYGGVAVESCNLNGSPITVIYGHLKLASIAAQRGAKLSAGDTIGILGADKSAETDGERKHLHLGIHRGTAVNILGYVQTQAALSDWLDPCLYVCGK